MQSSYDIQSSDDGLTYYFQTRFNVIYTLVLTVYYIEDVSTFSLSLYPDKEINLFDSWVKNTVTKIIGSFLENDSNIIFYICDSTDERETKRHKVFEYWYKKSKTVYQNVGKHNYSIRSSHGYTINSSLLYNIENPLAGYIIDKFERLMNDI
ncbi:hypothetical protein A0256_21825 [Mucilaginibacter sp. PAMC 26640]|nr:hypothetical protein A0256_21825 [Mucilaginibacter sp. PAMC 26640]